jgi:activator of HSP90 ATPase
MISDGSNITPSVSGASTPVRPLSNSTNIVSTANSSLSHESTTTKGSINSKKVKINTASVKVTGTFQVTAEDLWGFLTDDQKVPMWSRNSAKVSEGLS